MFSFLSGIYIYVIAWGLFGQDKSDTLGPQSLLDFVVSNTFVDSSILRYPLTNRWKLNTMKLKKEKNAIKNRVGEIWFSLPTLPVSLLASFHTSLQALKIFFFVLNLATFKSCLSILSWSCFAFPCELIFRI